MRWNRPPEELPPELVEAMERLERERYPFTVTPALEARPLPDEWVLRQLVDADLDDYEVVMDLLDEYGVLSPHRDEARRGFGFGVGVP